MTYKFGDYEKFHASPRMKKERAQRNTNRAVFEKAGRVKKGDGKEIDHKSSARKPGGGLNNAPSNLRVVKAKTNKVKQ
jgi:hypothetical protein